MFSAWEMMNQAERLSENPCQTWNIWIKNSGHDKYRSDDPIALVARSWWSCYVLSQAALLLMGKSSGNEGFTYPFILRFHETWKGKSIEIPYINEGLKLWTSSINGINGEFSTKPCLWFVEGSRFLDFCSTLSVSVGNSISNGKSRKEPHKCAKTLCMYIYIYT